MLNSHQHFKFYLKWTDAEEAVDGIIVFLNRVMFMGKMMSASAMYSLCWEPLLLADAEFQFPVQPVKVPSGSRIPLEGVNLLIHGTQFCITAQVPPRILQCWNVADLRRYGAVDGKFCFEGGSRCGKGESLCSFLLWFPFQILLCSWVTRVLTGPCSCRC